ncbi:uncharacterized protein LOC134210291 isoform X2 [Armigeres subalbatus]|uniref:uncharacterized protein LOC134210291 isoform X2 n=1 Tax=Armigeres subalbatus TaxID=124917 RepID=UPI002ED5EED5
MRQLQLILVVLLFQFGGVVLGGSFWKSTFRQLVWEAKDLYKICSTKNDSRWECLRDESLAAVDEFASRGRIPLVDGINLVRVTSDNEKSKTMAQDASNSTEATNSHGMSFNHDAEQDYRSGLPSSSSKSWTTRVLRALDHMFQTHVLQIDLLNPVDGGKQWISKKDANWLWKYYRKLNNQSVVEGRHRRHRHQMIPMMIFGVTVFGMFAIPMGFQFLAALSGKAFLMAKLALLLASINGLKRVSLA